MGLFISTPARYREGHFVRTVGTKGPNGLFVGGPKVSGRGQGCTCCSETKGYIGPCQKIFVCRGLVYSFRATFYRYFGKEVGTGKEKDYFI